MVIAVWAGLHTRADLALRRAGALALSSDEDPRDIRAAREERAAPLRRGVLGATAVHEQSEDMALLLPRPPEIMARAMDREAYLVQGTRVAGLGAPPLIGVGLATLPAPLADRV
jgi:hypothetical protein